MHRQVTAPPLRRGRGAPGKSELRRLRAGVFRLGSYLGLDTRAVVRFSEVISGQRWRRCCRADLELVVTDFALIAGRGTTAPEAIDSQPVQLGDQEGSAG